MTRSPRRAGGHAFDAADACHDIERCLRSVAESLRRDEEPDRAFCVAADPVDQDAAGCFDRAWAR